MQCVIKRVLRPLPLLAAVQVLLQRLELLPEARLAASEAARAALPQQLRDINIASPYYQQYLNMNNRMQ